MNKSLLKKISLGVLGIGILGGCITLFSYFNSNDKTLHLDYDIGSLTDQGKYLEDECKLYTKKAFACEGLRVTFDFDAEVNGQFYFYDINDKYLSKSDVVTEGSSVSVPLNGAYARAVVIPTNDEDGSISFTEKYKYGSQMQVKVNKKAESNVNNLFKSINDITFRVVTNPADSKFVYGQAWSNQTFVFEDHFSSTTTTLINVNGGEYIKVDYSKFGDDTAPELHVYQYHINDKNELVYLGSVVCNSSSEMKGQLNKECDYVLLTYWSNSENLKTFTSKIGMGIVISKTEIK